jgi:hypothetical protein
MLVYKARHVETRITAVQKGRIGTHQWDINVPQILSSNLLIVRRTPVSYTLVTKTKITVYLRLVTNDRGCLVVRKGVLFLDVS